MLEAAELPAGPMDAGPRVRPVRLRDSGIPDLMDVFDPVLDPAAEAAAVDKGGAVAGPAAATAANDALAATAPEPFVPSSCAVQAAVLQVSAAAGPGELPGLCVSEAE